MTEAYSNLLKNHIIHSLTSSETCTLKDFAEQLIQENISAREEIVKAYEKVSTELNGALNELSV